MSLMYVQKNVMTGSLNMDTLRPSLVENAILLPYSVASTPCNADIQAHSCLFDDAALSNSALEFLGLRPQHDLSSTNNSVQQQGQVCQCGCECNVGVVSTVAVNITLASVT